MFSALIKYISIYLLGMLKFIAGPTIGSVSGLSWLETVLITVASMMTSVIIFTSKGFREKILLKFFKKRKKFTKRNRRFVMIWKKWGAFGVYFLTPVIFTPIGGTLMMAFVGESRKKIIPYMFFSAVFWAVILSSFFHFVITRAQG